MHRDSRAAGGRLYLSTPHGPRSLGAPAFADVRAEALDAGDVASVQLRLKEAEDDLIGSDAEGRRKGGKEREGEGRRKEREESILFSVSMMRKMVRFVKLDMVGQVLMLYSEAFGLIPREH